jgi:endonuclease YncB( thermonuclease family)
MLRRNNQTIKTFLLLAALCLAVAAQQRQTITGKVIAVADGDTITVLDANRQERKIELNGIDAPELDQAFGERAKKSLSELVFGKTVMVASSKVDRYGSVVGKVTRDDRDINLEQIRRGYAWFYRQYANDLSRDDAQVYEQAEAEARAKERGLWAGPGPIPPWELRAAKGGEIEENQPGASKTPSPVGSSQLIGDRNSMIYHRPDCPDYAKVAERNRAYFKTESEAMAAGYRRAGNCP